MSQKTQNIQTDSTIGDVIQAPGAWKPKKGEKPKREGGWGASH